MVVNSNKFFIYPIYTAHQLCGIIPLGPLFSLTVTEIYVNVDKRSLTILRRPLAILCQFFYGQPSLLSCPGQPSVSGLLISLIDPKAVGHDHVLLKFSCKPSLYPNCHRTQFGNQTKQHMFYSNWKYNSALRCWPFSERYIKNYWSITRRHSKSPMPSWEQQSHQGEQKSYPGDTWAYSHEYLLKMITSNDDQALLRISWRERVFF